MVEQNQKVTVRLLPNGPIWPGRRLGSAARTLQLELDSPETGQMRIGDAVEVRDQERLYLGEILALKEAALLFRIEHLLERADLTEIARIWGGTPGEESAGW